MKIAIAHYHLRPGGVTRVIENAVASLAAHGIETVVLTGEPCESTRLQNIRVVDGLGYSDQYDTTHASTLAGNLKSAARDALGTLPDIWHFHNHALGKNLLLPPAIDELIVDRQRFLFQFHDFAEDGRPDNYKIQVQAYGDHFASTLYPTADSIHYAAINKRDASFLATAGLPSTHLHELSNPVSVPEADDTEHQPITELSGKRLCFYPTRSIRRKNIGEFLLWAAMAESDIVFAASRGPDNPQWLPIYRDWVTFAQNLNLPAQFSVVTENSYSFTDWINQAESLITTSIAEGFGLAFLEPYALGKPVVGRNLPEITTEFADAGIDLSNLYHRLEVPLDLIDTQQLRDTLGSELTKSYAAYRRPLPDDAVDRAWQNMTTDDLIDFGSLSEPYQKTVIEKIIQSPELREAVKLQSLGPLPAEPVLQRNREIVAQNFSLENYGRKLADIYRQITEAPMSDPSQLDADRLLNCFLDPERFRLLRT